MKPGSIDAATLAQQLGLAAQAASDDEEPELVEASAQGSSSTVAVEARGASDRVVVKLDGTYDITRPAFVQFLKDTYAALPHAGPAGEPGAD